MVAHLNLSGVIMDKYILTSMSSAPNAPLKNRPASRAIFLLGLSSGRLAIHVINYQSSQNQMGNFFYLLACDDECFNFSLSRRIKFCSLSCERPSNIGEFICQYIRNNFGMFF